jgi:hypothetical protein
MVGRPTFTSFHSTEIAMATGIMVTVKTNNPTLYLIGIILFILLGVGIAIAGFTHGSVPTGVAGIVLGVGAVILLVEYLVTR